MPDLLEILGQLEELIRAQAARELVAPEVVALRLLDAGHASDTNTTDKAFSTTLDRLGSTKNLSASIHLARDDEDAAWRLATADDKESIVAFVDLVHPLVGGKMIASRRIWLFPDPDELVEFWLAVCPSLGGITTQGRTKAEALLNAQEMVSLYLDVALDMGDLVPPADGNREFLPGQTT